MQILLQVLLLFSWRPCECYAQWTLEQEFALSEYIFVGEVVAHREESRRMNECVIETEDHFTFRVEEWLKGDWTEEIEMVSIDLWGHGRYCEFRFEKGQKYLVFAVMDDGLRTSKCTRTVNMSEAGKMLEEVEELAE